MTTIDFAREYQSTAVRHLGAYFCKARITGEETFVWAKHEKTTVARSPRSVSLTPSPENRYARNHVLLVDRLDGLPGLVARLLDMSMRGLLAKLPVVHEPDDEHADDGEEVGGGN